MCLRGVGLFSSTKLSPPLAATLRNLMGVIGGAVFELELYIESEKEKQSTRLATIEPASSRRWTNLRLRTVSILDVDIEPKSMSMT